MTARPHGAAGPRLLHGVQGAGVVASLFNLVVVEPPGDSHGGG